MTRARRAKWAALLAVATIAVAASHVESTFGAFAGQSSASANMITAMPDFRGPAISAVAIGKATPIATGVTGHLRPSQTYYVYANVTDVGTPPSGVATVTANVAGITAGQTAVPLVAGSYSAGGVTYNRRSAVLTAGALGNGPQNFSVSATDAAANSSGANGTVNIDGTAPAPTGIAATNAAAGTQSRADVGDVFTLTTNEALDPFRILATWDGSATTVQVRLLNQAGGDRLEIRDSTGATVLPFGTISLGRTDYCTATVTFSAATMTQSNGVISIALGGTVTGTPTTAANTGTMVWTPSATLTDRAGNAMPTAAFNEPAPVDRDF